MTANIRMRWLLAQTHSNTARPITQSTLKTPDNEALVSTANLPYDWSEHVVGTRPCILIA